MTTTSATTGLRGGGRLTWLALGVLGVLAGAVVLLSLGSDPMPFDVDSSAPDGYRAVGLLLEDAGVEVRSATSAEVVEGVGDGAYGPGDAIVVPVGVWLASRQLAELRTAAEAGATVVVAGTEGVYIEHTDRLTRTAAVEVPRGACDIAELEHLRSVDDLAGSSVARGAGEQCFSLGPGSLVARDPVGSGSFIELSSPYLWANARLQPDKEEGGGPLDNGPMAVALLGDVDTVTFVEADPRAGVSPDGTRSPLSFLPVPVELALAQAVGAFVLYAWWRSRRLGRPVAEPVPVEVAGSELVEAVGGLLRRRGSPRSAAAVLRTESRRRFSSEFGIPAGAGAQVVVGSVAARCRRDPAEVRRILFDDPVDTTEQLIRLSRELDELHTEVPDVQPTA